MTNDVQNTETWLDKKLERRTLLKKAAVGTAALGVLYVAPNFTSTGASRAFATTGSELPGCDEVGRATILEVCYNGENSGGSNDQSGSSWGTSGTVDGANGVYIVIGNYNGNTNNNSTVGPIDVGDCFSVPGNGPGNKVGPNTEFTIYDGIPGVDGTSQLMHVFFHTSCSQPLEVGDQFGPIVVSGFNGPPVV